MTMRCLAGVTALFLATACPGPDDGAARLEDRLERAARAADGKTTADCEARLAALARMRPDDLAGQAEAALRIVALEGRLRADPGDERACAAPLREVVWSLATRAHQQGRKGDGPVVAGALYRAYLDRLGATAHPEARFYLAEVLWVKQSWRAAAEQYDAVVRQDPGGPHVREAAYAAIVARRNVLGPHEGGHDRDGGAGPISGDEQALMDAFDTYLRVVPASPERVKVLYRKARTYYEHGLYDQAIPIFDEVIDHHAGDELAVYAANLVLDSLNVQGKTEEVKRRVMAFAKNEALMKDAEFAHQMRHFQSDIYDLEARRAYREARYAACGRGMKAAMELAPDHPKRGERLTNAVRCFRLARDFKAAAALGVDGARVP